MTDPSACMIWFFKSSIFPASTLEPKPPETFGHKKPSHARAWIPIKAPNVPPSALPKNCFLVIYLSSSEISSYTTFSSIFMEPSDSSTASSDSSTSVTSVTFASSTDFGFRGAKKLVFSFDFSALTALLSRFFFQSIFPGPLPVTIATIPTTPSTPIAPIAIKDNSTMLIRNISNLTSHQTIFHQSMDMSSSNLVL